MTEFTPDEIRLLGFSAPLLLRMLEAREVRVINKIHGEFRAGKTDQTLSLAELSCLRDITNEIKSVLNGLKE